MVRLSVYVKLSSHIVSYRPILQFTAYHRTSDV